MVSVIQQESISPFFFFLRQMYITADKPAIALSINDWCGIIFKQKKIHLLLWSDVATCFKRKIHRPLVGGL